MLAKLQVRPLLLLCCSPLLGLCRSAYDPDMFCCDWEGAEGCPSLAPELGPSSSREEWVSRQIIALEKVVCTGDVRAAVL